MSLGDDGAYGGGEYGGQGPTGQTRTRLPGGEGDVYGTGRRPRSGMSSRNLVTIVGVVVLLIAAIAFANRGTGPSTSDSPNTKTGAPAAQPTSPTGEHPVSGENAKNPTIPSGFPKTEQGAQSAAANYAVALASDGMYKSDARDAIVDAVYAPAAAAARKESLRKVYDDPEFLAGVGLGKDGTAPDGMTFVSRANPVGTKVEKFGGTSARVSVWYSSLFGLAGEGSENPVTESWYTTTMKLQWVSGDWKVTDVSQKKGPAPVGRDQAAATAEEMSKAVEGFGGFTYAR
ncbi:hypothetical protein [Streptomyces ochraceiscleroticus]|uniref:Integral membrane protein n=1 Tax=Streptomyces ochraceiscleroticus TaxID=47761 RepID=A0ABW1MGV7_9ACTN|nr:hypothetical protein [Streptomyces ochraceiscleroticus]